MNPFMEGSVLASTGMPTLGRRAKGFGSSPFGPGGPVPVHDMNFFGMAGHGMHNSPWAAGRYPHPRSPFPLGISAAPMMSMPMGANFMGGGMDSFMSPYPSNPFGGSMGCMGMGGGMPPWLMPGFGGGGGLLDGLEDMDDTGAWDGDDDGEGLSPFDIFYRTNRRAKRKGKGCGMLGMPGMMPTMGMPTMGMRGGMGMGSSIGCM